MKRNYEVAGAVVAMVGLLVWALVAAALFLLLMVIVFGPPGFN